MIEKIKELIQDKKVLILGFGREGQSTYQLIRSVLPVKHLSVADQQEKHEAAISIDSRDKNLTIKLGTSYLSELKKFDLIIKSPGIKLDRKNLKPGTILTSQTQLFLAYFAQQCIGITGTKGKSTTASLLHHILSEAGKEVVLIGNIGTPAFSAIDKITKNTIIVFELSAHQLENLGVSPQLSIFLNLYQEHLDHFGSFELYLQAKTNIFAHAKKGGKLIFNLDQAELKNLITKNSQITTSGFSTKGQKKAQCFIKNETIQLNNGEKTSEVIKTDEIKSLIGKHNLYNIMASLLACSNLGISKDQFVKGLQSFKSLEHRLEYVGEYQSIHFYNDSISTIPEATIAAVKCLPETDTLILGGFDRGINYNKLVQFLTASNIYNLIFMGPAGKRMQSILTETGSDSKNIFYAANLEEAIKFVFKHTKAGKICLLSPAASSYDQFKNFEERGHTYKKMARN